MRELSKLFELEHELKAISGLRYEVDRNHDLIHLELETTVSGRNPFDISQAGPRATLYRRDSGGPAIAIEKAAA